MTYALKGSKRIRQPSGSRTKKRADFAKIRRICPFVCLKKPKDSVHDIVIRLGGGAQIIAVDLPQLAAVTQKNPLPALLKHNLAQMGFLSGGVGNQSLLGYAPAGKKEQIRIEMANKVRRICAHICGRIMQHQPSGAVNFMAQAGKLLSGLEPVGHNRQRAAGLQMPDQIHHRGGRVQKKNLTVLQMLCCLSGDPPLGLVVLLLADIKRQLLADPLQQNRPTMKPLDQPLTLQFIEIPADGGLADIEAPVCAAFWRKRPAPERSKKPCSKKARKRKLSRFFF